MFHHHHQTRKPVIAWWQGVKAVGMVGRGIASKGMVGRDKDMVGRDKDCKGMVVQSRHVQVRTRRRVHLGTRSVTQDGPRPHRQNPRARRRGITARCGGGVTPQPCRTRQPNARQDLRGHVGDRPRPGRGAA